MVLAGSSCLWSEVVGLRAGSNASGRPHPWLRERERAAAASAGGFHCATFSQKKSCQTHDLSTLLETAYVCVCMSKRHREQRKKKWVTEPRERERKGIYRQCFADRDVLNFTEEWRKKIIRGQTHSTCPVTLPQSITSGHKWPSITSISPSLSAHLS